MITYHIEIGYLKILLTAQTDTGARRQCAAWLKANPPRPPATVHLCFFRASDGCTGTIDR